MALLDSIRAESDTEQTRNAFYNLYKRNADSAIGMLGDERLRFPTLYILRPEITKLGLEPFLSARNISALALSKSLISDTFYGGPGLKPAYHPVLRWMLLTGYDETGLGNEYDKIMDLVSILLVKAYGDRSCLQAVGDMIFMRHRKGLYTYDAEWAFFESGEPDCLAIVAKRLLSKDAKDVSLARRYLKPLPCFDEAVTDPVKQHRNIMQWVNINIPYLYYTGEHNKMCGDPCRFRVSDELKYLQKNTANAGELTPDERMRLENIQALDADSKRLLGEYSDVLHKKTDSNGSDGCRLLCPLR